MWADFRRFYLSLVGVEVVFCDLGRFPSDFQLFWCFSVFFSDIVVIFSDFQ